MIGTGAGVRGRAVTAATIAIAVLGLSVAGGRLSEAAGQQRASSGPLPKTFGFGRPAMPRGCHGPEGEGGTAAPVVGRDPSGRPLTVGNLWPYATTLYDYINRAMPRPTPGMLTPDQVYSLVAWILAKNEIIAEDAVMNAETLPAVVMPARDRFVPDDRRGGPEVR